MKRSGWLRLLAGFASVLAIAGLWRYGASTCNEACSAGRALSMQVLSLALPAAAFVTVVIVTGTRPSPRLRWAAVLVLVLLLFWGCFVSLNA